MFSIQKSTGSQPYFEAVPSNGESTASGTYNGRAVTANRLRGSSTGGLINVCNNFDWSPTPYTNAGFDKQLIPYADITEYRLNNDAIARSILYFATATLSAGNTTINGIWQQLGGNSNVNMLNTVSDFFQAGAAKILPLDRTGAADLTSSEWMKPYEGLYCLTPTNFRYLFPYFDNVAMNKIAASYRDVTELSNTVGYAAQIGDFAANFARIISPGQYVERPKIFDPAASSLPSITISFPLLNTLSFDSAVKNYQLLWLLAFQNVPQRVTKTLIELPKLYEVNVPGVSNLKFCYMESLDIDFIGNRRRVRIPMPAGSGLEGQIYATMPDAYNVKMTFRSLIMNSGNLMLEAWKHAATNRL